MTPRMASLRQRHTSAALTAFVVLAALVWAGDALGAGGAPLPAPDDPPSSQPTGRVKAPAAKTSTATKSGTDEPTASQTSVTPSPDPPVSAETASRTAPAPAPARTAPVAATPVPSAVSQPAVSQPAPSTTTRASTPTPKPRPKPHVAAVPRTTPPTVRPPHDVRRLGLPLARLVPVTSDESKRTALLVAAAILLVASGAGSLTVGLSVRRLARGA
jgi:hypothetical protein